MDKSLPLNPESQQAAQNLQGLQQKNAPSPPEGKGQDPVIVDNPNDDERAGANIVRILKEGPCKTGFAAVAQFSEDLRSQLKVVKDQQGSTTILPVCLSVIGEFTRNLVKQLTPNFVAMIFLAAIFKYGLHTHLLSAHPELKKRRHWERHLLLELDISIDDNSTVSRMCRVGAAALEVLDAGLPLPIHPDPMIQLLPTAKTPAKYLDLWRKLVAEANGQVPDPKAIADYVKRWRRTKDAAKKDTPAARAAAVRKELKAHIDERRPDFDAITALFDKFRLAINEVQAGTPPRPKKVTKKKAPATPPTPMEPPALPDGENQLVQGVVLERRQSRVLVHATDTCKVPFKTLLDHLKKEQDGKPYQYSPKERCQLAAKDGAQVRDFDTPVLAAAAYAALAGWCQTQVKKDASAAPGGAA